MPKIEKSSVSSKADQELSITKLSQITGIAQKTAQAMYEIGIHDYADLMSYLMQHTPEQFSQELKEHGVNRRPGLIDTKTWMKQAQVLSQAERVASAPLKEEIAPAELLPKLSALQEARDHGRVFTVSFDTAQDDTGRPVPSIRVYDESNGGKEAIFQGAPPDAWVDWILERANLPWLMNPIPPEVEPTQESLPIETKVDEPLAAEELKDFLLKITNVRLSVVGRKLAIPEKKLKVEINLKLSGAHAERLSLQTASFLTEIYAINLDDGSPMQLGSREDQFKPHIFEYSYQFDVAIPALGRYELHSVVHLLPYSELMDYHRGPVLKVTS